MRVLTWNLYHGRSTPPAGRALAADFAELIAAWSWDIALLQEVPPWWPQRLAEAAGARAFTALTSRNTLPRLRRAIAERRPDLIGSNGGGANVILARTHAVRVHQSVLLRRWPERRVAQFAHLQSGLLLVNTHLSTPSGWARDPRARARAELAVLWTRARVEAGPGPVILGGDLNLFDPEVAAGDVTSAGHAVDHVIARGCGPVVARPGPSRRAVVNQTGVHLSDHEPLLVDVAAGG